MWAKDTCKLNIKIPNDKGIEGEYTRKLLVATSILKENTTAAEQIKRYANSSFHATQNLRDFVDNDFQTKEDLRYTQTRKQTWHFIVTPQRKALYLQKKGSLNEVFHF